MSAIVSSLIRTLGFFSPLAGLETKALKSIRTLVRLTVEVLGSMAVIK